MHRRLFFLVVGASLLVTAVAALAAPPTSITLDGSLGHGVGAVSPTSPGFYAITPGMGRTVGANLFQSFGTFNLGTGDTADFQANLGTQNIIARVTGGSASSIDGTLASAANLYFINPAGIMFTSHAALNVNGAFVASTANYVKLSDGNIFYADTQHPINDAGLTSAPVSAFGFLPAQGQTPAPVTVTGAFLENPGGLHVIAGDITLDGAILYAPSGNLTLFSAASGGEVPFSLATPGAGYASATTPTLGAISLQNVSRAAINSPQGGGSIVIRGGHLVVENSSRIASVNTGANPGGSISIEAISLAFQGGGQIFSNSTAAGAGGDVTVQAGSISADGTDAFGNGSGIFAQSTGSGNAGNVMVTTTSGIAVTNGAGILTTAVASAGGNITIQSGSLDIDGSSAFGNLSLISSFAGATGVSGSVHVTTGALTLSNGGQLDTQTANTGGDLFVTANSLLAEGASLNPRAASGLDTFGSGAGQAGSLQINVAGLLELSDGGTISTLPGGGGAGTIAVTAGSLIVAGTSALGTDSSIYAAANSAANAGTIDITVAGAAQLSGGASINTATFAQGDGGSVVLRAGSLSIDGADAGGLDSGIYSGSEIATAAGNGGTLQIIVAGLLSLTNGGSISAGSQGTGNAGDITVNCGALQVDGADANGFTSAIASVAVSSGNGGNVTVNVTGAASVTNGGEVSADASGSGHGGDVHLTAGQLQVDGSTSPVNLSNSQITSNNTGAGQGGVVDITVAGAMSVTNGGQVSANSTEDGNAGSVAVRAGRLTVAGADVSGFRSTISSTAAGAGDGGQVAVTVGGAVDLAAGGLITAASGGSGNAGSVTVHAGTVGVSGLSPFGSKSSISSSAFGTGNGGTVEIIAPGGVTISDFGGINAFSNFADAGTVRIVADNLTMTGDAVIQTGAAVNGGNITLKIGDLVYLLQSSISASAGNVGGNITIDPLFVVLDQSSISAFGGVANGNIVIDTNYFLDQSSPVEATGAITISVPDLDLSRSLLPLPIGLVDDEKELRETCARSIRHESSSLIVVGRGGTESAPDELQPDFGLPDVAPPVQP
jgi:filamentous hemagglutinin family protein